MIKSHFYYFFFSYVPPPFHHKLLCGWLIIHVDLLHCFPMQQFKHTVTLWNFIPFFFIKRLYQYRKFHR